VFAAAACHVLARNQNVDWVQAMTSRAFIQGRRASGRPAIPGPSAPSSALHTLALTSCAHSSPGPADTRCFSSFFLYLPRLAITAQAAALSNRHKLTVLDAAHALNDSLPELASRL
jgi:hypothetical protein